MSIPKKLDLSIEELVKIAQALNENTIANKDRAKEDKIGTDIFIRRFGVSRKDFAETVKGTPIQYNRSTFLYDIPGDYSSNTKVNHEPKPKDYQSITPVNKRLPKDYKSKLLENKSLELPSELQELISLTAPMKEMLEWYHMQRNTILVELPEIDINGNSSLSGEVFTKSFKVYKNVLDAFNEFASSRKETQKDLLSLAILEFMKKYNK